MAQAINTNIMSLNAQRQLNNTQNSMQTSIERLSSGLRINSAKDDAAGLAIANRMTAQIRGLNQAVRNANDGISLAQTGEGALQEITNNLQRMRELAVQSRNVTNTTSDRQSLDSEFQQLLAENDRLAQTTAFNGRKVLDGSLGSSVFQVGANVGETISVDVSSSMRNDSIGSYATVNYALVDRTAIADDAAATALTAANLNTASATLDAAGDLVINGVNVGAFTEPATPAGRTASSAFGLASAINAVQDQTGVTATATAASTSFTSTQITNGLVFTDDPTTDDTLTYTVSINGVQVISQQEGDAKLTASEIASAINVERSNTGVQATVDSVTGALTLTAADGRNIELTEEITGASEAADQVVGYFGGTLIGINGTTATAGLANVYKGGLKLESDSGISVQSADDNSVAFFNGVADGATDATAATTISSADVLSETNADTAINKIDQALTDVDVLRGVFGAIQSRFESTVASLSTTAENLSAARSRIQDADFAAETAELTRAQILQQAGVAMVAQANALPQSVLSLLG